MPKKVLDNGKRISMIGRGLDKGLTLLGERGGLLRRRWSVMSEGDLRNAEAAAMQLDAPGADRFDESRLGTRWLAYGRTGVACALLRNLGRQARATEDGVAAG